MKNSIADLDQNITKLKKNYNDIDYNIQEKTKEIVENKER